MLSLVFTHLCKLLDGIVGPAQLLPEHLDVALHVLGDGPLSVHLDIQRAQVVQLHELLL